MLKTLLKKQLQEIFALNFGRGNKGKKKASLPKKGITLVLFAALMIYVVGVFAFLFFSMGMAFASSFSLIGLNWLYFALVGILATSVGIISGIFIAYSTLYEAKDNELLLSLPIKPSLILFSRMAALYVMELLFEALVMIPMYVAYAVSVGGIGAVSVINFVITLLVLPLLSLALSSVLGFFVALVASRIRNKTLISIFAFVIFFGLYYYVIFKFEDYIALIISNGENIASGIKTFVYPIYCMGAAIAGEIFPIVPFVLSVGAVFALVYFVLSKSFIKLATTKRTGAKRKYRKERYKAGSVSGTLLKKEFSLLWNNATYALNAALGTVFMIFAAVFLLIKGGTVRAIVDSIVSVPEISVSNIISLGIALIVCFLSTMNVVTGPSISVEAKTLWLLRSLPVSAWQILSAKLALHLWISVPAALILSTIALVLTRANAFMISAVLVFVVLFNVFYALLGLILNLKLPKLNWTTMTVAVKQSFSVLFTMLIGFAVLTALVIAYIFTYELIGGLFIITAEVIMAVAVILLFIYLKKRGTKIFDKL